MSVYNVYTHKKFIPVITSHRCSKCGHTVVQKQVLSVESKHNDRGAITKKSIKKREDEALNTLSDREKKLRNDLKNITAESDFVSFRLNGRCSQCGYVEPWARIRCGILETLLSFLRVIGALAALFAIFLLFDKTPLDKIPTAVFVIVGIWLLTEAVYLLNKLVFRAKTRKLSPESLPKIYTSEQEIAEMINTGAADNKDD